MFLLTIKAPLVAPPTMMDLMMSTVSNTQIFPPALQQISLYGDFKKLGSNFFYIYSSWWLPTAPTAVYSVSEREREVFNDKKRYHNRRKDCVVRMVRVIWFLCNLIWEDTSSWDDPLYQKAFLGTPAYHPTLGRRPGSSII